MAFFACHKSAKKVNNNKPTKVPPKNLRHQNTIPSFNHPLNNSANSTKPSQDTIRNSENKDNIIPPFKFQNKVSTVSSDNNQRIGKAPKGPRKKLSVRGKKIGAPTGFQHVNHLGTGDLSMGEMRNGGDLSNILQRRTTTTSTKPAPIASSTSTRPATSPNSTEITKPSPTPSIPSPPQFMPSVPSTSKSVPTKPSPAPTSLESLQSQLSASPNLPPTPSSPNKPQLSRNTSAKGGVLPRKPPPPVTPSIILAVSSSPDASALPSHLRLSATNSPSPPAPTTTPTPKTPISKNKPSPPLPTLSPSKISSSPSPGLTPPTKLDSKGRPIVAVVGDVEMSNTMKKEWEGQLESISEALKMDLPKVRDGEYTVDELIKRSEDNFGSVGRRSLSRGRGR